MARLPSGCAACACPHMSISSVHVHTMCTLYAVCTRSIACVQTQGQLAPRQDKADAFHFGFHDFHILISRY